MWIILVVVVTGVKVAVVCRFVALFVCVCVAVCCVYRSPSARSFARLDDATRSRRGDYYSVVAVSHDLCLDRQKYSFGRRNWLFLSTLRQF